MNNVKLSFTIQETPAYAIAHKGGRKTLEIQIFDGIMTCDIAYTFNRRPLTLETTVGAGMRVELILMPHRIELYVDGKLLDEEWPAGERLYEQGDAICGMIDVFATEYKEERSIPPCVISRFENAEGWKPDGGVFVGDCMPYRKDDEYHVLYLKDRKHHKSKWGLGAHQWEHISTKDFKTFEEHPMAVEITDPDEGSICTGSWMRNGDKEYLYYTVRKAGKPAPICRSVSLDGYHFEKDKNFHFELSNRYTPESARDPKIVQDEKGVYHMFLTTTLAQEKKGCLAHYVSKDLDTWQDSGTPIYVSENADEPECPDYIHYQGKYYLIFSLCGVAHYLYSDSPFDGWKKPKNDVVPCSSVPKGAIWENKIVFTGFNRIDGYAGTMTFKSATASENGELVFEE